MPTGLGAFPLAAGPYGGAMPSPAVEATTTAVNARRIDTVRRDYTTDADGNADGMDGTAGRVYLLLSYADTRQAIITATGVQARAAAIRRALEPLTRGPAPAVTALTVNVVDAGGERINGTVTYRNLLTNTLETVQIR